MVLVTIDKIGYVIKYTLLFFVSFFFQCVEQHLPARTFLVRRPACVDGLRRKRSFSLESSLWKRTRGDFGDIVLGLSGVYLGSLPPDSSFREATWGSAIGSLDVVRSTSPSVCTGAGGSATITISSSMLYVVSVCLLGSSMIHTVVVLPHFLCITQAIAKDKKKNSTKQNRATRPTWQFWLVDLTTVAWSCVFRSCEGRVFLHSALTEKVLVYQYLPQNPTAQRLQSSLFWIPGTNKMEAEDAAVLLVRCEDLVQSPGVHSSLFKLFTGLWLLFQWVDLANKTWNSHRISPLHGFLPEQEGNIEAYSSSLTKHLSIECRAPEGQRFISSMYPLENVRGILLSQKPTIPFSYWPL